MNFFSCVGFWHGSEKPEARKTPMLEARKTPMLEARKTPMLEARKTLLCRMYSTTQQMIVGCLPCAPMTPLELEDYLSRLIAANLKIAVMLWGAPGIGKSSIVRQLTQAHGLEFVDLRLSQLAPTDLRGLPVAEGGVAKWFPPEFLPTSGRGILFLDELNMAAPTMQGIAQQLILDRAVGSYTLPDGWFVWAAGNRREDRASVFEMPAPLSNRFLHLEVVVDLESFKRYALKHHLNERIIAFLAFRPNLLHAPDTVRPAWASPRSWEMASRLLEVGLSISPAVGEGTQAEFRAFEQIYHNLPEIEAILSGDPSPEFPQEPSARYAVTIGLVARAGSVSQVQHAFAWLIQKAEVEWVHFFTQDAFAKLRISGQLGQLVELVEREPRLKTFVREINELTGA
jgi:MoxR-like ATPase